MNGFTVLKGFVLASIVILALSLPLAAAFPTYAVIDMGTGSGTSSWVTGISRNGHVSVDYQTASGIGTFVWFRNTVTDLGSPFGSDPESSSSSGVNDRGWVIGQGLVDGKIHAFIYRNGVATDLGTLGSGFSDARGVNEPGFVVGLSQTDQTYDDSFVWTDGQISPLGAQSEILQPPSINDRGQIAVGPFLYLPYPAYGLPAGTLSDLGTLPNGTYLHARAINSIGHVVGEGNSGTQGPLAFIWRATQNSADWEYSIEPLGVLPGASDSSARGVNSSDQVVGRSGDYRGHSAFLWQAGDGMANINDLIHPSSSIGYIADVLGISDDGYIAPRQTAGASTSRAILLVPSYGPQKVSLTPSGGNLHIETKLTFTAVYRDPKGWQNLSNCYFLVNTTADPHKAAYFRYDVRTNKLFTASDGADSWMGGFAPGIVGKTVANGYGRLYCEGTAVSKSGTDLTVKWTIALKSPYAARLNCGGFMRLTNLDGAEAGWDKLGQYTVGQ